MGKRLTSYQRLERAATRGAERALAEVKSREQKQDLTFNQLIERMASLGQVLSGISVTPQNAMRCTTVQGIVRAFTNAIGSYPVAVGQIVPGKNGPSVEPRPDHALNRLLAKPNAIHTQADFFRLAVTHTALWGNHYSLLGQGATGPISFLRPIEDPDAVQLDSTNSLQWGRGAVFRVSTGVEAPKFVPQSRILHFTSGIPSSDGVTGASPVRLAKEAIGICLAAEHLIGQLYANNDMPTLALTGGKFRDEEDYALWVAKFREARGSISDGRGGTLMLPDGMDAKELSFKPVDAQLLEMRKFQRIEIAQVYGVPPHKLADLERATFSNIEEQSLEWVRDAMKPQVRLFQLAMQRDLLTPDDQRAGFVIRFDMEEATEGKLKDRIEAFGKAHDIGAMSPNEVRQRLGMNPRTDPGGDQYVLPLNMRTNDDDPQPSDATDTDADGEPEDRDAQDVAGRRARPLSAVR